MNWRFRYGKEHLRRIGGNFVNYANEYSLIKKERREKLREASEALNVFDSSYGPFGEYFKQIDASNSTNNEDEAMDFLFPHQKEEPFASAYSEVFPEKVLEERKTKMIELGEKITGLENELSDAGASERSFKGKTGCV